MTVSGHRLRDTPGRRGQVLSVDTSEEHLDRRATALARHAPELDVHTTTDAEAALSSLPTADCVLVASTLEGTSGIDVLHAIRDRDPRMPVILVVDHDDESTLEAALSAGVTDVVGRDDPTALVAARLTNAITSQPVADGGSATEAPSLGELKQRALDEADLGVLIAEAAPDMPTVFANEGFGRLTGYDPEAFVGQSCRVLQGEGTDDRPVQSIRDALSAERSVSVVLRNYRKDGTPFWNEVDISPVSDPDGTVTHFLGFQRDVTERTTLQQELESVQRSLRGLYTVTTDSTLSLDERIERTLTLACERLDVTLGFVTRLTDDTQRIVHSVGDHPLLQSGDECPLSKSYCRRTLDTNELLAVVHAATEAGWDDDPAYELFGLECYLGGQITVDGELFGTLCFADSEPRPEPFTESQVVFVELLTRWLSYELERRQHERDLQTATRRFRALFDNPHTFAGVLDPDGTLCEMNDTALATLEDPESARDQPFWEAPWWTFDDDSVETVREAVEAAASGETVSFECAYAHGDGEGTVSVTIYPVYARADECDLWTEDETEVPSEADSVVSLMAVGTDTTTRTEQAAQLHRQRDRLEEFASVVSHDLRSPLEVARGRLQLYEQTGDADHLVRANGSIDRMSTLIDDLLALARQGEGVSDPVPTAVAEVARLAWNTVRTPTATFTVDLDSELTIDADPSRLRQLFENLFRNCVEHGSTSDRRDVSDSPERGPKPEDATGAAGEITATATEEQVDVRLVGLDDGRHGFAVEDDGRGIDPGDRAHVFDRGFSTTAEGTGFGLAIVQRVAEAHGWDVEVTESERGGARFELCFGP